MPLINIKIYGRNGFTVPVGIVPISLPHGQGGQMKTTWGKGKGERHELQSPFDEDIRLSSVEALRAGLVAPPTMGRVLGAEGRVFLLMGFF